MKLTNPQKRMLLDLREMHPQGGITVVNLKNISKYILDMLDMNYLLICSPTGGNRVFKLTNSGSAIADTL